MKPATVGLIKKSTTLHSKLAKKMGALGTALVHGDLNGINFTKIISYIEKLDTINTTLMEAYESSNKGMYQSNNGKWVSSAIKVGAVIVLLGCGAWVIYDYISTSTSSSSDNLTNTTDLTGTSSSGNSGVGTTLTAIGAAFSHMLNAEFKNQSDEEAVALKKDPPKMPDQINAMRAVVEHILNVVQKTGPEAQAALVEYQKFYPQLPSKIKRLLPNPEHWHPELIGKVTSAASGALTRLDRDSDDEEGSGTEIVVDSGDTTHF